MLPLVLACSIGAPAGEPAFVAASAGEQTGTGSLVALSLTDGVQLETANGPLTIKGPIGLRRVGVSVPARLDAPQLITAGGDRIAGVVRGGDAKAIRLQPAAASDHWSVALDGISAVWFTAPPADTPIDPAAYEWAAGTPTRDVLLYRNGDTVRGALTGFTDAGVKFTPDDGAAREVPLKDLAAISFNPRFARARKPKGAYAHLVLTDGTRLDVIDPAVKDGSVVAKAACGPAVELDLSTVVALTVMQGPAVYLSDLKPKSAETGGFLGVAWPWAADRTVRGKPLRLLVGDQPVACDKGLGTHPKTVLTYDLAGKYQRFEALVGLDAATGTRGRASVRVLVDGKEADLPALKALTAGAATAVRLDVVGAKELTLVVDFGPAGDVQADVNWGDARLILK